MAGDLRRDIEVADAREDHISEAIRIAISGGAIFNNFDDTVKALTDGIGQVPVGEGDEVIEVIRPVATNRRSEGIRLRRAAVIQRLRNFSAEPR